MWPLTGTVGWTRRTTTAFIGHVTAPAPPLNGSVWKSSWLATAPAPHPPTDMHWCTLKMNSARRALLYWEKKCREVSGQDNFIARCWWMTLSSVPRKSERRQRQRFWNGYLYCTTTPKSFQEAVVWGSKHGLACAGYGTVSGSHLKPGFQKLQIARVIQLVYVFKVRGAPLWYVPYSPFASQCLFLWFPTSRESKQDVFLHLPLKNACVLPGVHVVVVIVHDVTEVIGLHGEFWSLMVGAMSTYRTHILLPKTKNST